MCTSPVPTVVAQKHSMSAVSVTCSTPHPIPTPAPTPHPRTGACDKSSPLDHVLFVEKRARNRPNLLRGVLAAAPSAGAAAGCAVSVGAASAAEAPLRRRRNILRSPSRFLSRAGGSAGAVAGGVGADSFSFTVKTKAASPARTVKASTWLASTDGGGGARALARALQSKTPTVTPSRGNRLKSSSRVDFRMGVGFGLVWRMGLRGTTMGCPLPDQTTVPGLGATGFLTAGFITAGFFTAGFLTAGFFTAGFFTAGLFGTGFLAMGVLTAGGDRFLVARFLGAALPPENITGHTAACVRTTAVVILPPAGTCHADTVETRTSSSTPDERIAIEPEGMEGRGPLFKKCMIQI